MSGHTSRYYTYFK